MARGYIASKPRGYDHVLAPSLISSRLRTQVPALETHPTIAIRTGTPFHNVSDALRIYPGSSLLLSHATKLHAADKGSLKAISKCNILTAAEYGGAHMEKQGGDM